MMSKTIFSLIIFSLIFFFIVFALEDDKNFSSGLISEITQPDKEGETTKETTDTFKEASQKTKKEKGKIAKKLKEKKRAEKKRVEKEKFLKKKEKKIEKEKKIKKKKRRMKVVQKKIEVRKGGKIESKIEKGLKIRLVFPKKAIRVPTGIPSEIETKFIHIPKKAEEASKILKLVPRDKKIISEYIYKIEASYLKKPVEFQEPVRLEFDYSSILIEGLDENTLRVYKYDSLGKVLFPLPTKIDKENKKLIVELSRLSYYLVMADIIIERPIPKISPQIKKPEKPERALSLSEIHSRLAQILSKLLSLFEKIKEIFGR